MIFGSLYTINGAKMFEVILEIPIYCYHHNIAVTMNDIIDFFVNYMEANIFIHLIFEIDMTICSI